ncbi:MAG: hypothetical protein V4622_12890 [Bacteroidota bacterium]
MKYFFLTSLLLFSLFSSAQKASNYMNNITEIAKSVRSATWDYTNSVSKSKSAEKVEDKRLDLLKTIDKSEKKVKEIGDFNGESYYKDSILSFLKIYKDVISDDYQKIKSLELNAKHSFEFKDKLIIIREEANTKIVKASEMLDEMEVKFAAEHKIELVYFKSKVAERLKKANKVYKYYNSIFLIFFKPYFQEAKFLESLDKDDLQNLELSHANLLAAVVESKARLNVKLDFEGDNSLMNSCQKLLDFYQAEAEQDFIKLIEFKKFKVKFQKTKTDLEAKAKTERAKNEVAEFNKMVEEYNQKMSVYNQIIETLNIKRESLINSWNAVGEEFEEKHLN